MRAVDIAKKNTQLAWLHELKMLFFSCNNRYLHIASIKHQRVFFYDLYLQISYNLSVLLPATLYKKEMSILSLLCEI